MLLDGERDAALRARRRRACRVVRSGAHRPRVATITSRPNGALEDERSDARLPQTTRQSHTPPGRAQRRPTTPNHAPIPHTARASAATPDYLKPRANPTHRPGERSDARLPQTTRQSHAPPGRAQRRPTTSNPNPVAPERRAAGGGRGVGGTQIGAKRSEANDLGGPTGRASAPGPLPPPAARLAAHATKASAASL